eukprot:g3432.t1
MGSKSKSLHAEVMLVARCARDGISTDGSWLYCLQPPCWNCLKALMMAGITRIVFQEPDIDPNFQRQREVVDATGGEWRYHPATRKRRAYLQAFQDDWAKNHLPRHSAPCGERQTQAVPVIALPAPASPVAPPGLDLKSRNEYRRKWNPRIAAQQRKEREAARSEKHPLRSTDRRLPPIEAKPELTEREVKHCSHEDPMAVECGSMDTAGFTLSAPMDWRAFHMDRERSSGAPEVRPVAAGRLSGGPR